MSVIGYPTPGKEKARIILEAFCAGAPGGEVVRAIPKRLLPGAAVFYGVVPETKHLWDQARREGRDWYYIDNAYFDRLRQVYFRATRNALQHHGTGYSDGRRLLRFLDGAMAKVRIEPWLAGGEHVLVCPQSEPFMRLCAEYRGSWIDDTVLALQEHTRRKIVVRPWDGNKTSWYKLLPHALRDCWALVTYSSASAITAMLAGVPAFVTAQDCVARSIAFHDLSQIDTARPGDIDDRRLWAEVVADNQWTLDEMRSGVAWRAIGREVAHA